MKQIIIFLLLFLCVNACTPDQKSAISNSDNSFETWVFRSVLDGIPRMLTAQLDKDVFVSYNTQKGSLYKAWKGIVNMEGAVFNGAHGPQPTAVGDSYLLNEESHNPWSFKNDSGMTPAVINYKGHKFNEGDLELMYEISDGSKSNGTNQNIFVTERISTEKSESGQLILNRIFKSDDAVSNLIWKDNSRVVDKSQITISSEHKLNLLDEITMDGKSFQEVEMIVNIDPTKANEISIKLNKPTHLDPNLDDGFGSDKSALPIGAQLIGAHDCKTCHNSNKKTIGPAYVSIANKYEHTDENIRMLSGKIKKGGSGIWGEQVMTPHPEISDYDLKEMISYIFTLGKFKSENKDEAKSQEVLKFNSVEKEDNDLIPGSLVRVYNISPSAKKIPTNLDSKKPIMGGILANFNNLSGGDFAELGDNFALTSIGYLEIDKAQNYDFRLWSDDGSKLFLHDKLVIDHDGHHGTSLKQGQVYLEKGFHPYRIEFFQGGGGKFLSFNYKPESAESWEVAPTKLFSHDKKHQDLVKGLSLPMSVVTKIPGDQVFLDGMHPSFDLSTVRPSDFNPKVGGMDFLSDGRLIVSLWDEEGGVYIVSNTESENPEDISYKKIAQGLAEPLGVKVVNDRIFVMQKQELTELIDHDNDEIIDEYRVLCDDWGVSSNFHEFGFGLAEKNGYLYANLATGIMPGGAGRKNQHPDRGSCIKVSIEDGSMEIIARGLRTPNGIGKGHDGELFIADNQGDWLPSSKIVHVKEGDWFGSRAVDFEGTANLKEKKPVVWLPQDEIGNSPTTPLLLNVGPYKNQMIHGEVTHGGIKRVFVEKVNNQMQGCVFRFMQGMEAGVNRIAWAPDGQTLYAGGIGNPGNWQHSGKLWYGLQKMKYNSKSTFEMLSISARSNGIEIEFTEPINSSEVLTNNDFEIKQWYYKPTADYGGPKLDEKNLKILSLNISDDRKKVFLELSGMKENHVIYTHIKNHFTSQSNNSLWTTEGWYTMNYIPTGKPGFKSNKQVAVLPNTLSESEKADGWELLFDGKSMEKFHTFKSAKVDSKWVIEGDAIHFNPTLEGSGGDLVTDQTFENYEFQMEWKISNCGNSGIFFNVVEDEKYCCTWQTGVEMQILDNTCHPDTKFETHRAGDLYDMIQCKYVTVKPAGEWNKIKIVSNKGEIEFWQNGHKVVEFTMHDDNWTKMIANSKFKDMPDFGLASSGHIAVQDHGDKVWFRNIKIKIL